jgi:hypothetical protein
MKSLRFVALFLLLNSGTAKARVQYFLSPGFTTTGFSKGWEVTLLRDNEQSGGGAGEGLVFGKMLKPDPEIFIEAQVQSWVMAVLAGSLGAGGYQTENTRGMQATLAIQFYTPFLFFTRLKLDVTTKPKVLRPMFGLMFKLPMPVSKSKD